MFSRVATDFGPSTINTFYKYCKICFVLILYYQKISIATHISFSLHIGIKDLKGSFYILLNVTILIVPRVIIF